jgi:hypothetical protein
MLIQYLDVPLQGDQQFHLTKEWHILLEMTGSNHVDEHRLHSR